MWTSMAIWWRYNEQFVLDQAMMATLSSICVFPTSQPLREASTMKVTTAFGVALLAGTLSTAGFAQTILFSTDFETDPSANFTVQQAAGEAVFNYNAAAWTPGTSPFPDRNTAGLAAIPAAPSAAGATGLYLRSNFTAPGQTTNGVAAYITAPAVVSATEYTMEFDAFQMYNGPQDQFSPFSFGTTTMMTFGLGQPTQLAGVGTTAFQGFFLAFTTEGGTVIDARYYSGIGGAITLDAAFPNFFGTNRSNYGFLGTSPQANEWNTVFTTATGTPDGIPGRRWVTWQVVRDGATFTVSVKEAGAATFTEVATFTVPIAVNLTNAAPFVGFADPFTGSIADPAADNFALIDNLRIFVPAAPTPTPGPLSARQWNLHE
jgi:hypothetical protein